MAQSSEPEKNLQRVLSNLGALRDELGDYLATIQRNTDATNQWLDKNRAKIILGHQHLVRALNNKNKYAVEYALKYMEDTRGFIMSIQNFAETAAQVFGKDHEATTAISTPLPPFPEGLLEDLPELSDDARTALPFLMGTENHALPEEAKGFVASLGNLFNGTERRKRKQMHTWAREIEETKAEICGMQDEQHYYIDSFMDWVVDTLAPEATNDNGDPIVDNSKMLQYKNPDYVIARAFEDFHAATQTRTDEIRKTALHYATIARTIDDKNPQRFIAEIIAAYPSFGDTHEAEKLRKILRLDYGYWTMADLILHTFDNPEDQTMLMKHFARIIMEEPLTLRFSSKPEDIFKKIIERATADENPISAPVVFQLMSVIKQQHEKTINDFAELHDNIFTSIAARYDDPAERAAMLSALIDQIDGVENHAPDLYSRLHDSLTRRDVDAVTAVLSDITQQQAGMETAALWYLCHPDLSLGAELLNVSDNNEEIAALIGRTISAGMFHEVRISDNTPENQIKPEVLFENIVSNVLLAEPTPYTRKVMRLLIAHTFSLGGLNDHFREMLTNPTSGWFDKIITSKQSDEEKAAWISTLLEPFAHPATKAAILHAAAENNDNEHTNWQLIEAATQIVGDNIPVTEGILLTNLDKISNIWFNDNALHYTTDGVSHPIAQDIDQKTAHDILDVIARRHPAFQHEKDGVFNPARINSIHTNRRTGDMTIAWYRAEGPLNLHPGSRSYIQNLPTFIHSNTPFTRDSFAISNICALIPQADDKALLIDKYGVTHDITPLQPISAPLFNPEHASVLRLNAAQGTVEFRIESTEFDKLLDMTDENFFHSIALPAKMIGDLQKSMAAQKHLCAVGDDGTALYFNAKTLGYLAFDDNGFACKRYCTTKNPGYIEVDPDIIPRIRAAMKKDNNVISIGDLDVHSDCIDMIAYDDQTGAMHFVVGNDYVSTDVDAAEAARFIDACAKDSRFIRSGNELANISRMTLISAYETTDNEIRMVADSNRDLLFGKNLTSQSALMHNIEQSGITAHAVTEWAKKMKAQKPDALAPKTSLSVMISPVVHIGVTKELLKQATKQLHPERLPRKSLKDSFSTASQISAVYSSFTYPSPGF